MILLVTLLSLVALVSSQPDQCAEFGEFMPWSQCLFFPLANITKGVADACQTSFQKTKAGTGIPLPEGFTFPEKCGHCSFKVRCRKRDKKENCYSLDMQKETCNEFGDVCTVQKHPKIGCRYNLILAAAKNCLNRPELDDWRRDAIRRFADGLPQGNCIEKDGQCKCCCHPYLPNDDGTACVKQNEAKCDKFGAFNQWTDQCLWYPIRDIANSIKDHCQLDQKTKLPDTILPVGLGLQIPQRCGYCSFKARCRQRPKEDGCFHIDAEKKACGPNECAGCGDVCQVNKINGTCDWGAVVGKGLMDKVDLYASKLPYWRRRGIYDLARHIPYGKCKEINGKCSCCCHPYEVSEDGTRCELGAMCSFEPIH